MATVLDIGSCRPRRGVAAGLDASGMLLSTCCAAHCAAMPLLTVVLPAVGLGLLADERAELALIVLSATLGVAGCCLGYRTHGRRRVAALLAGGIGLLALGHLGEGGLAEPVALALTAGGGLSIAGSHLLNRRLCRSCVRPGRSGAEVAPSTSPSAGPGRGPGPGPEACR